MKKTICLFCLIYSLVFAENNAVDFMETGLSARAMAMGNAMTASGHGLETVQHNPATLALKSSRSECNSSFANNFGLVDRKHIGFAMDNLGFTLANCEVNGILKTTWDENDRPLEQGTFSSNKYLYALTYAHRLSTEVLYGMNLKKHSYLIDTYSANGIGLDIGGMYRYPEAIFNSTLMLGSSLHNVGRTRISWSTGHYDTIPMSLTIGASLYSHIFERTFVLTSDLVQQENEPLQVRNGLEYWLSEQTLAIRLGADMGKFTIGLGLQYADIALDYAQADYGELGIIKRLSITAGF